jgi:hypothetical protein
LSNNHFSSGIIIQRPAGSSNRPRQAAQDQFLEEL